MSLLTALNDAQRLCSLPVTTSIVGDAQESQQLLLALARAGVKAMMRRQWWDEILSEHTFNSTAAALQVGGLPADYDRMVKRSFFNRATTREVSGPVSPQEWQRLQTQSAGAGGTQFYRIRRGGLYLYPTPAAGQTMAFEYASNQLVESSVGAAQDTFEADNDEYLFGDETLKLDVRWRYLQEKGLDYAEAMKDFELWLSSQFTASSGGTDVSLFAEDNAGGEPNFPDSDFG